MQRLSPPAAADGVDVLHYASRDYQQTFERSSGRDLRRLFDEWVY